MTPQEAADEDRMVTQAEYGAEIEAETTEKDPSELQYITPIDYSKRIAELDEDLRDAAEILVTDCSCYTPFRAFLMDVVQSDFAFMPNKLDLIRDIALGTDNAERKAYSNNKYGLVEYSIRSGYVKISYKNRNGVRKEGALDWRELYEILSYMVKQPFYCGEDQKKYYQETKQKADRDKMNPVYKRFFDIEDSVKANRLETRERAIANGWETKIDENGHVVSDDAVQKKHNFHYNLWELEKGGPKTRYQWNMDAIRTLKQIESENRLATPEEQKVLSKFIGWGGLSQTFDEENAGWSKEYEELKEMLSDEEYAAARATVNNAFYTSPEIAMCMNSALVQFGFRGGNVLEHLWVSVTSLEVCRHLCREVSCMGWSLTAFQEELQSSFIRMPISVSQDLRIPHIRITSLMWLSEMCHLVIIRYLIQSTTSITSVSTIIFWQKHLIR